MKFEILAHVASMHTKFCVGAYLGRFPEWWKQKISAAEVEGCPHSSDISGGSNERKKKNKANSVSWLHDLIYALLHKDQKQNLLHCLKQ